jgi:hypothetical protein
MSITDLTSLNYKFNYFIEDNLLSSGVFGLLLNNSTSVVINTEFNTEDKSLKAIAGLTNNSNIVMSDIYGNTSGRLVYLNNNSYASVVNTNNLKNLTVKLNNNSFYNWPILCSGNLSDSKSTYGDYNFLTNSGMTISKNDKKAPL